MPTYQLVIIGGGPAGLAAAAYALHAQLNVALIAPDLGGKVTYPFELRDMPRIDSVWGASLVYELEQRVRDGLRHHLTTEVKAVERHEEGGFVVRLANGEDINTQAVILATGARAQRLYVPGEWDYFGRGVSFSAISHAPYFHNRIVAVVGSGQRAITALQTLIPLAKQLYFIEPRRDDVRHVPAADRALTDPKVSIFRGWEVQQVLGDDYVTAINLVGSNGEIRTLDVEGVFVQFSLLPNNALVRGMVDFDEDGHIVINHRCETSQPGIFAAGDLTCVHAEQVPVSIGEGAKAGLSAWEYLAALS